MSGGTHRIRCGARNYTLKQLLAQFEPLVFGKGSKIPAHNHHDIYAGELMAHLTKCLAELSSNAVPSHSIASIFTRNSHPQASGLTLVGEIQCGQAACASCGSPGIEDSIEIRLVGNPYSGREIKR